MPETIYQSEGPRQIEVKEYDHPNADKGAIHYYENGKQITGDEFAQYMQPVGEQTRQEYLAEHADEAKEWARRERKGDLINDKGRLLNESGELMFPTRRERARQKVGDVAAAGAQGAKNGAEGLKKGFDKLFQLSEETRRSLGEAMAAGDRKKMAEVLAKEGLTFEDILSPNDGNTKVRNGEKNDDEPKTGPALLKTKKGKVRVIIEGWTDGLDKGIDPKTGKHFYKGKRASDGKPYLQMIEDNLEFLNEEEGQTGVNGVVKDPEKDGSKEKGQPQVLSGNTEGGTPFKAVKVSDGYVVKTNGHSPEGEEDGWKITDEQFAKDYAPYLDKKSRRALGLEDEPRTKDKKDTKESGPGREAYEDKATSPENILKLQEKAKQKLEELKQQAGGGEELSEETQEFARRLANNEVVNDYLKDAPAEVDKAALKAEMLKEMERDPAELKAEAERGGKEVTKEEEMKSRLDEIALLMSIGNIEEAKKKLDELRGSLEKGDQAEEISDTEAKELVKKRNTSRWKRLKDWLLHPVANLHMAKMNRADGPDGSGPTGQEAKTTEEKKKRRRALGVLGGGLLLAGVGVAAYYLGKSGQHAVIPPEFCKPRHIPPEVVPPFHHGVDWSSFNPNSFGGLDAHGHSLSAHDSVKSMFNVFRQNGYQVHGLTDERVNQVLNAMKEQHMHVAFGIDASGNQHILDAAQGYSGGHAENYLASNMQGLEKVGGTHPSSVENWHKFADLASRYGISITKS